MVKLIACIASQGALLYTACSKRVTHKPPATRRRWELVTRKAPVVDGACVQPFNTHQQELIMRNPWMDQHMQGEMEFTGGEYTRRHAAALVRGEYEGHEEPDTCGNCGADAFYRATVGAYQCPACRSLQYTVWVHKETGEERRGSSIPGSIAGQYRLERRWTTE